ncbi:hypothetical protein [Bacillus mobilis]|uniref:hypothetical protein n=1 Tax=Bacillus cereus group TaxID=86661 RepID=UPI001E48F5EA|nr:hypothetical protein [Bacillus mobilis]MCC2459675.1 hypothetical protein [Bacillus mobilis]
MKSTAYKSTEIRIKELKELLEHYHEHGGNKGEINRRVKNLIGMLKSYGDAKAVVDQLTGANISLLKEKEDSVDQTESLLKRNHDLELEITRVRSEKLKQGERISLLEAENRAYKESAHVLRKLKDHIKDL